MILSVQLLSLSVAILFKLAVPSLLEKDKVEINICPSRDVTKDEGIKESPCITLDRCGHTHCIDSSMIMSISAGQHELQATINVLKISNLLITGSSENTTTITCSNSAAFSFHYCLNITLKHLIITGCGTESEVAAVFFQEGDTVTLEDVTISDSIRAAFVASNVQGLTLLLNSTLRDTTPGLNGSTGNVIIYNNGNNNCSHQFVASNSHFCNRKNFFNENSTAGFTVNVSNCCAIITINNSEFTNNYHPSSPGGNLRILLRNVTKPSQYTCMVCLENVTINQGKAFKGGGLVIDMHAAIHPHYNIQFNSTQNCSTIAVVTEVLFHNNMAEVLGAGLYIQQAESSHASTVCQNIQFINCTFTGNSLSNSTSGGIAIHSNTYIIQGFVTQIMPQYIMELINCAFHLNYDSSNESSVIVINAHKHFEIDSITVTNNHCNALTAIYSNLVVSGSTTLSNNVGSSGGGLLLCENAILYFKANTYIEISNNKVLHAGGGICIEPQCLEAHPRCFFQFYKPLIGSVNSLNITISVTNNSAMFAGDNIFGGDVDYCYMVDSSKSKIERHKHDNNSEQVFSTLFTYDQGISSITSPPRKAYYCNSIEQLKSHTKITPVFPGQTFNISAILVGQINGFVPGVIEVKSTSDSFKLHGGLLYTPGNVCNVTSFYITNEVPITKMEIVNLTLTVQISGDKSGYEKLGVDTTCRVEVPLMPCPAGSTLSSKLGCKSTIPNSSLELQNEKPHFMLTNIHSWIQLNYDNINPNSPISVYYKDFCPLDYCQEKLSLFVAKNCSNQYPICQNNRAKLFCGACAENFSAMLGSSSCKKCKNNLILLLPFALAGIVLVVFLTVLNLNISKGTLSGLIFYANIIESNYSSLIPNTQQSSYLSFLKVFIGWLNLDLAIPACFYNGMDAYAEAWLEFAFPIYISILSLLIIVLSEKYAHVATLAGKNSTKVLATLVLLSYTRFLRAIIFNFSYIQYIILGKKCHSAVLWLIDPNISYWELKHIILFTFSLLFALVCFPFTLILLFIKPLQHFSHAKPFHWISRLKPFLDAFTGPYTDNGRFWPGMLLIARIAISLTAGMNFLNDSILRLGVTILVIIFILIAAASVRPGLYVNGKLDFLEYFFLLNLCTLCLSKGYSYHQNNNEDFYVTIFQILVSLSLFTFAGIILYHIWIQLRRSRICLKIVNWILKLDILRKLLRKDDCNQTLNNYPPHGEFIHQRIADHEE